MSRSYRKSPVLTNYSKCRRQFKRFASKKVRKTTCGNYGNYKKVYPQWDICDWKYCFFNRKEEDLYIQKYRLYRK